MSNCHITITAGLVLTILAGIPATLNAQTAPPQNQSIAAIAATTATLKGRVLDDAGKPLPEQSVMFYIFSEPREQSATANQPMKSRQPVQQMGRVETDSNGAFNLRGAPAHGQVLLSIKTENFALWTESVPTPNDNLEIRLRKPYTKVSGQVTRADNGAPVAGAKISLYAQRNLQWGHDESESFMVPGDRLEAISNSDGHYETTLLPEGQITMDAVAPNGLRPVPLNDKLYTTTTLTASAPLALPDIVLYPGYALTGQVRDAETKAPIANAEVGFMLGGARLGGSDVEPVKTDAQGNYTLPGANPTPDRKSGGLQFLFFQAKAEGYKTEMKTPKLTGFDKDYLTVTQDFELTKE